MKNLTLWQWIGIDLIVLGLVALCITAQMSYTYYVLSPTRRGLTIPSNNELPFRKALYYHRWYLSEILAVAVGVLILHKESMANHPSR